MSIFAIGPFTAADAALDSSPVVAGLPSMTALAGVADVIARAGGQPAANLPVALLLHYVTPHSGMFRPAPQPSGEPAEAPGRLFGRVRATICLADPEDTLFSDTVRRSVQRARFAGARMEGDDAPVPPVRACDDLGEALRSVPPGHLLADRTDILEDATTHAADPLDALLDVATLHRDEDGRWTNPYSEPEPGVRHRLTPLSVGFQVLEPIENASGREGTREPETPHVFAEGVATVSEFVSARALARAPSISHPVLWSWHIDRPNGLFVVRGRTPAAVEGEVEEQL